MRFQRSGELSRQKNAVSVSSSSRASVDAFAHRLQLVEVLGVLPAVEAVGRAWPDRLDVGHGERRDLAPGRRGGERAVCSGSGTRPGRHPPGSRSRGTSRRSGRWCAWPAPPSRRRGRAPSPPPWRHLRARRRSPPRRRPRRRPSRRRCRGSRSAGNSAITGSITSRAATATAAADRGIGERHRHVHRVGLEAAVDGVQGIVDRQVHHRVHPRLVERVEVGRDAADDRRLGGDLVPQHHRVRRRGCLLAALRRGRRRRRRRAHQQPGRHGERDRCLSSHGTPPVHRTWRAPCASRLTGGLRGPARQGAQRA